MKRFLLAALLALIVHGLFFGFVPRPFERTPPKKSHIITISLASYDPVKPKPAAKPARIIQERPSKKPPEKKQNSVIRPLPTKKAIKAPPEIFEPGREVEEYPEKSVRPQKKVKPLKKAKKPLKRIKQLQEKPPKPKVKPKVSAKTVMASLVPEKKKAPVTPSPSTHASASPKAHEALPIESFPDIPEGSEVESVTEIASIPPAKVVREARPAYKVNPPPQYPKRARRRGYEGTVVLEVLVNGKGRVKELRILTSSGHRVLDRAALKSVNGWLFEPGMVGDEKVDMWVRVPVRFELRGG